VPGALYPAAADRHAIEAKGRSVLHADPGVEEFDAAQG
jgi:hypothetical protein